MKFGPSRGHFLGIFEHFFKNFGFLVLLIGLAFFKGPMILINNLGIVVIIFATPFVTVCKYFFTKYSIDDEKVKIESGLFVKKKMEIPLKAITTVDLSQNLLFQVFDVYKIKADNASQTNDNSKEAEVTMYLKKDDAMFVKVLLESQGNCKAVADESDVETAPVIKKEDEKYPQTTTSFQDFILMGLLQSKQTYVLAMISSVYAGVYFIGSVFINEDDATKWIETNFQMFKSALGILILVAIIYILAAIGSAVSMAVRYFGYTVTDRKDSLVVDFGLFTKKHYTLPKKKISGITITQPLLMRVFGYCTVEVFIIGYGDSNGKEKELSILCPIIRIDQASRIMGEFLPDMTFDMEYKGAEKGTFHYFFFTVRVYVLISAAAVYSVAAMVIDKKLFHPAALATFVILGIITAISVWLEYKNSGIYANKNVVSIRDGILARKMIFVKTVNVESVSGLTNIFKQKKGYMHIRLGFLGPIRVAHIKAKNVSLKCFEDVKSVLEY